MDLQKILPPRWAAFVQQNKDNISSPPLLVIRSAGYMAVAACTLLLAFAVLSHSLKQQEKSKINHLLNRYQVIFHRSGSPGLQRSFSTTSRTTTAFLRLEGPRSRFVLISNNDNTTLLPDFSAFPPDKQMVWKNLQTDIAEGPWTVAATRVSEDVTLQIGILSRESLQLSHNLARRYLLLFFCTMPLCFLAAWLSTRSYHARLQQISHQIRAMSREADLRPRVPVTIRDHGEKELIQSVQDLLTRHRQLAEELQESMDNVAHDLRTPITRLRSIAEYGLHKPTDTDHLQEALTDCLEESDRLMTMLNTMLSVTEAQANTVVLNLQPVSLKESIGNVLELYDIIAQEQDVTISFAADPDLSVLVDPDRISQVWANLLDNAIKYNATSISIRLYPNGPMAAIDIRDDGMGISANELQHIWTRLYRGDRSRSKPGLGLGLTLVKAIIENHGGSITVTSNLDTGTTFTVQLPMVPPE